MCLQVCSRKIAILLFDPQIVRNLTRIELLKMVYVKYPMNVVGGQKSLKSLNEWEDLKLKRWEDLDDILDISLVPLIGVFKLLLEEEEMDGFTRFILSTRNLYGISSI